LELKAFSSGLSSRPRNRLVVTTLREGGLHMRKSILSLTLLALAAGGAATALAQGLPTTQPKFLHIYRER
jgi:hypothetical protein